MSHVEVEPIRGLPEELPPGEVILWQGEPNVKTVARTVFHIRSVAIYFFLLAVAGAVGQLWAGHSVMAAIGVLVLYVPLAGAGVLVLALLARAYAKSTVYTITNRRVVLRYGVVLPMSINIPFRIIGSVGLRLHQNGRGDLPMALLGPGRIGYIFLWPHARPWKFSPPEPMLRAVEDAASVGALLADALAAEVGGVATSPRAHADDGPRVGHPMAMAAEARG